ncbi:MAG TPA: hypothetical protein VIL37_18360 [Natronosporangium sp.]
MAEPKRTFPRRDEAGRVAGLPDLLALTAAALVTGFVVLLVLDLAGGLVGWGEFGQASGWLALILPGWLFLIEELRAWRAVRARLLVVVSGALLGIAVGLLLAGFTPGPPLISSGAGAAAAALVYAVYWYYGIRWLARREGSVE